MNRFLTGAIAGGISAAIITYFQFAHYKTFMDFFSLTSMNLLLPGSVFGIVMSVFFLFFLPSQKWIRLPLFIIISILGYVVADIVSFYGGLLLMPLVGWISEEFSIAIGVMVGGILGVSLLYGSYLFFHSLSKHQWKHLVLVSGSICLLFGLGFGLVARKNLMFFAPIVYDPTVLVISFFFVWQMAIGGLLFEYLEK